MDGWKKQKQKTAAATVAKIQEGLYGYVIEVVSPQNLPSAAISVTKSRQDRTSTW